MIIQRHGYTIQLQKTILSIDKKLEVVAFEEIKSGAVDAQLYINFFDEKAIMYSYFYLGEDDKVWQYQIIPNTEPLEIPVSN